jgi:hypothetical protein
MLTFLITTCILLDMMKDDSKKHTSQDLTEEERAERRKYHRQMRERINVKRIKEANQILLAIDETPERTEWAKNFLREKELVERIDTDRQELRTVRARLKEQHRLKRIQDQKNRKDRPRPVVSEEDHAKRRELNKKASSHRLKTLALINHIIEELVGKENSEVFDLLPHDKALILSEVSYGQLADRLNDKDHKTLYGKKWSRASVKRILDFHGGKKFKGIGHVGKKTEAATNKREKLTLEYAKMINEEVLPMIDTTLTHHEIAFELNKRGIKTRTKNEWGNSAVSRLLKSIKKLESE